MPGTRIDLTKALKAVLGSDYVYFNPDATIKMKYPCLVCSIDRSDGRYADNGRYFAFNRYTVTLITRNMDDPLTDKLPKAFRYMTLDRTYSTSGLHHFVYELYF